MTSKRLKHLIVNELHITQRQFAYTLGISESHLSKILNNKSLLTPKTLQMIEKSYHVNIDWLVNGNEPIFHSTDALVLKQKVLDGIEHLSDDQIIAVSAFIRFLNDQKNNTSL